MASEVLKASRTDAAAVAMLAQALIAQNRGDEAVAPLEKVVRRSSDAGLETLLGAALGNSGRREDAIAQLRRTAARRPPFPPAVQELAGQLPGPAGSTKRSRPSRAALQCCLETSNCS